MHHRLESCHKAGPKVNKKLSCHREAARCSASLKILLSHSMTGPCMCWWNKKIPNNPCSMEPLHMHVYDLQQVQLALIQFKIREATFPFISSSPTPSCLPFPALLSSVPFSFSFSSYRLLPSSSHKVMHARGLRIWYDSVYLTCSKKLTGSQLSQPGHIHGSVVGALRAPPAESVARPRRN